MSIARPSVVLYQGVLAREAGEGAAVVAGGGAVGVEHFAQAVRAVVVQARPGPTRSPTPRRRSRGWKAHSTSSDSIAIFTS